MDLIKTVKSIEEKEGKRGLGYMSGSGVEASARSLSLIKNEEASTISFSGT